MSLAATGVPAPRDADMQERQLGRVLNDVERFDLRRGNLVFWLDHIAIALDRTNVLHASGYHMAVAREPLADVIARNGANGAEVTNIRRLTK